MERPKATGRDGAPRFAERFLRRPAAVVSIVWLVILFVAGVLAPYLPLIDPLDQDLGAINAGPTPLHWLGTDALGRDILSRLTWGAWPAVAGIVVALLVATAYGVTVGMVSGYLGGVVDRIVGRVVDTMMAMPTIVILLAILAIFNRNMVAAMVTLGILASQGIIRVVRSASLAVREEAYVGAARIAGLGDFRIVTRHILPRIVGPIIVQLSLFAAVAVLVQTGLCFLGLGVPEPLPSWGGMIYKASTMSGLSLWQLLPPGVAVALTALSFGLLGDSARDAAAETWSAYRRTRTRARRVQVAAVDSLPSDALLAVEHLRLVTSGDNGRVVVSDVSFTLRAGECLGVVGESGCGKTLTSMAVLGLLPPGIEVASGSISVEGRRIDLRDERALRKLRGRTVGMIFQEPMAALDPCFTVESQLSEVIVRQGRLSRSAVRVRVLELLNRVQIRNAEDVARRYPHQLSGGMAQRVAIARALVANPRVLIADEPTTALDVTVQAEILDLLRDLRRRLGLAVLLVTHDWGVVADSCDRSLVLYAGAVTESADTRIIFEHPHHPYTIDLMDADPHHASPGQRLKSIRGSVPINPDWSAGCVYAARCRIAIDRCREGPVDMVVVDDVHLYRCVHSNAGDMAEVA